MQGTVDPVTFAVVRNSLGSAAREMYHVFKRTAMLPILYEFNDFGMSLFDSRLNLIADAPGLPIFIGSLDVCIEQTLREIGGEQNLEPGDIIFNNHPYLTAGQPADAAVIEPVFHSGEIVGYSSLRGHMGDLGAKGPYPCDTTDIWQEGTLFPSIKLYKRGELNEDLIRILKANSRLPMETAGSVLAAAGAVRACTRKVNALIDKYGIDTYWAVVDEILDHGERVTRKAVEEIPDGTYEFVDYFDNDGIRPDPVELHCAVTIDGSDVTVDLSRSAPQQLGSINCPWGYTLTTCRFALKRLLTPDLPPSSGENRMLRLIAPEGSIFNPIPPAPTFLGGYVSLRLADMILQALAPAVLDRIPAQNGGCLVGLLAYLRHPVTQRWCFFFDLGGIGHGASKGQDGMNALIHPIEAGCQVPPLEVMESRMPILKSRFELVQDSGGPGQFRGGLAAKQEWEFLSDGSGTSIADKTTASDVLGLAGGNSPPYRNAVILFPDTERELRLGKKSDIPIAPGDRALVSPAGGGGYGDPLERDPEAVLRDVAEEYVSREQASSVYGVVLYKARLAVDYDATVQRREQLRNAPQAG